MCATYQGRISIRQDSFFEGFGCKLNLIMRVVLRWCGKQPRFSIIETLAISEPTLRKILNNLILRMKNENLNLNKFGGSGCIVQIDETMLNFKCKSHRGRSTNNKTDAICITEVRDGHISKVWAQTIPNKQSATLIPIICDKVISGSTIYTDEFKSYISLAREGFVHKTICHKYMFVDSVNNVHTQAVESFNNCLKYEIKIRKGVLTEKRDFFLSEFVWKYNNRKNLVDNVFRLLKLN